MIVSVCPNGKGNLLPAFSGLYRKWGFLTGGSPDLCFFSSSSSSSAPPPLSLSLSLSVSLSLSLFAHITSWRIHISARKLSDFACANVRDTVSFRAFSEAISVRFVFSWPFFFFNEIGHDGSRDRKRGCVSVLTWAHF